ncbi:MAG: hypothetical protein QM699_00595 [Amaricoccus sp.]|uniref:hypothetical protein n=1 Tax=Amaricoccus sp. TaxID=1872485 RepID=UPI0039E2999C
MTIAEFKARLREMGLTPSVPIYAGGMVYEDRDGQLHNVPDPSMLSPEEREEIIVVIARIIGFED